MRDIKMKVKILILSVLVFVTTQAFANSENERLYLIQILNQLNAIKPMVIAASKEQPKTNRLRFRYLAFKDACGKTHNGLLEDIHEIEKGIIVKLHQAPHEPRTFAPIKGDYINLKGGSNHG